MLAPVTSRVNPEGRRPFVSQPPVMANQCLLAPSHLCILNYTSIALNERKANHVVKHKTGYTELVF